MGAVAIDKLRSNCDTSQLVDENTSDFYFNSMIQALSMMEASEQSDRRRLAVLDALTTTLEHHSDMPQTIAIPYSQMKPIGEGGTGLVDEHVSVMGLLSYSKSRLEHRLLSKKTLGGRESDIVAQSLIQAREISRRLLSKDTGQPALYDIAADLKYCEYSNLNRSESLGVANVSQFTLLPGLYSILRRSRSNIGALTR